MTCSYSYDLAKKFSREALDVCSSLEYRNIFPEVRLNKRAQAVDDWRTTKGGGYIAAGVGGSIVGKGANILIVDDPVKNRAEVESPGTRELTWNWYTSTAYTRLAPGGGVLVIQTRWHDDDLTGRLLEKEKEKNEAGHKRRTKWERVVYEAIASEDEKYRKAGEALHPERYVLEELEEIKLDVGPREWVSQYQQKPVGDDGEYFKRSEFRYYDFAELDSAKLRYYTTWDLAIGEKESNDFSVGITAGVDEFGTLFLVDLVKGKWGAHGIVEEMIRMWQRWESDLTGVEAGHINMAIGPFLTKRQGETGVYSMAMLPLQPGRRDKISRARSIQGRLQQGRVLLPKGATWLMDFENELLRFPAGKHDDQVDAFAWLGLMLEQQVGHVPRKNPKEPSLAEKIRKLMAKQNLGEPGSPHSAMGA